MGKEKQNLDDFLRAKLSELPNAPVAGFENVERRMAVKSHRGIVLMLLLPLIASGLYWLSTWHEGDFTKPPESIQYQPNNEQSIAIEQEEILPITLPLVQDEFQEPVATVAASEFQANKEASTTTFNAPTVSETAAASELVQAEAEAAPVVASPEVLVEDNTVFEQETATPIDDPPNEIEDDEPVSMAKKTSSNNTVTVVEHGSNEDIITPIYAPRSKWEVTLNFYPNYTFRDFKINPKYAQDVDPRYEQIISESERGGFGYNAGVTVRYNLGADVFIASGLGYIENKVNGRYNFDIYQDIDPTYSQGTVVGKTGNFQPYTSIPIDKGIIQTFRYLQVPMHISYQPWATNRVRLLVEGGVSYIRFLSASGTTLDYATLVPRDVGDLEYVKNMMSFDFKVGAAYYISNSVAIGVEPSLMYFSQSIFAENHPTYVVPWSVGLNFNVRMQLY